MVDRKTGKNAGEPGERMITRRAFIERAKAYGLGAAAAATLASTLGFPMSVRAAEKLKLTFFIFAGGTQGDVPREVGEAYMAEHPDVELEFFASSNTVTYPKMKAARFANPDEPLVNFGYFNNGATHLGDADDMWEPLSTEGIPNLANVLPSLRRPEDKGAAFCVSPIGIIYNKKFVSEPPKKWMDLFTDPALKGKVVGYDYSWPYNGALESVLMNGGDLAEPDAGFEFIAEHADQFLTLVTGTQQAINLFVSGQAWACYFSRGIALQMTRAGADVGFVVPEEGAITMPLFLQIVNGTTDEQRPVAEAIINELLTPERVAQYCTNEGYAPGVEGVTLPEPLASDPAFQPSTIENAMKIDWATLAAQDANYRKLWDRVVKPRL